MNIFRKTVSILAVLLLSGLLINGITMTQQLKKIHASLEDNIDALAELNEVQAAIISKNEELERMVDTLDSLDQGLGGTIDKTGQTLAYLSSVVDYNADSLRLNDHMVRLSQHSGTNIKSVRFSLAEVEPYLKQLDQILRQLAQTAERDQRHLERINRATRQMNTKIPEVNLP
jgi:ABC-type transporter Mla subunit MlaD